MSFWPFSWHAPEPTPAQLQRGLILLLSGIEGGSWPMQWAYRAFREAGIEAAIRTFHWQLPFASLANVMLLRRNRRKAVELAKQITRYRQAYPDAPVDLVGYSGGGGIALFAVEALPADVRVRNVILVQPALSSSYDLHRALAHIDGRIVSFFSPIDWFILGFGTLLFGTIDRKHVRAAGMTGFNMDRNDSKPYRPGQLEQVRWSCAMMKRGGHFGNHLSMLRCAWNRQYVAPYLMTK